MIISPKFAINFFVAEYLCQNNIDNLFKDYSDTFYNFYDIKNFSQSELLTDV